MLSFLRRWVIGTSHRPRASAPLTSLGLDVSQRLPQQPLVHGPLRLLLLKWVLKLGPAKAAARIRSARLHGYRAWLAALGAKPGGLSASLS
jgi:hypothetical protein